MYRAKRIGFIGGGNMAEALIKGLLAGGLPAGAISVAEPLGERRTFLAERYGVNATPDNRAVAADSDVVVLAIKPQIASEAIPHLADGVQGEQLYLSIMAGITTATLAGWLGGAARIVRAMPNTPALLLQGATGIAGGSNARPEDIALARQLCELVGVCAVVEEKQLDAVTGLSGSGPAYVFTFIEALSDAGVKCGLPREVATRLAAQTVAGAAQMVVEGREHPAVLRERVTSPGGTTIAGLHALENGGFRAAVINAVEAATHRSRELGQK